MPPRTDPPATARTPRRSYAGKDAGTRQSERREKLIVAAIHLIGRQGYAQTSIDAVCREAGLTKRYFYESFSSSDELLIAAFQTASRRWLEALLSAVAPHRGDAPALVRAGVEAVFGFVRHHPDEARLILIDAPTVRSQLGRVYAGSYGAFVRLLVSLTQPFLDDPATDETTLTVLGRGAVGAIVHLCQGWLATDYKQPAEELIRGTERLLGGIGRELGVRGWATPSPRPSPTQKVEDAAIRAAPPPGDDNRTRTTSSRPGVKGPGGTPTTESKSPRSRRRPAPT